MQSTAGKHMGHGGSKVTIKPMHHISKSTGKKVHRANMSKSNTFEIK